MIVYNISKLIMITEIDPVFQIYAFRRLLLKPSEIFLISLIALTSETV